MNFFDIEQLKKNELHWRSRCFVWANASEKPWSYEDQKLREELKQKDEENFENSAAAARQGQLKKARIAHEISKECPSSVILSGKYYWYNRACCSFAYTYVFFRLRLLVKFERQHI